MKNAIITLSLLATLAHAQNANGQAGMELQVIGAAGSTATTANGASLHFTVGEMATETLDMGASLAQGFHQILVEPTILASHEMPAEPAPTVIAFPNPATDYLLITTDRPLRTTLYDLNGRQALPTVTIENTAQIDLKNLPAGTYFLRSTTPEGRAAQNFKVQIVR